MKNLPAVLETQVIALGQEDPLEKRVATHSSIRAWRVAWTEEPGGLQSMRKSQAWLLCPTNTFIISFLVVAAATAMLLLLLLLLLNP